MKALVIFGSASDSNVYSKVVKQLEHFELRICSAHRTPDLLDKILKKNYDFVIAGAGLAAHLPGVIASKTIKPVIGIPVEGNFNGLDALLSIIQMPPGVPVLATGVNGGRSLAKLKLLSKKYDGITIIGDEKNKRVKKAMEILQKFSIKYEISDNINKKNINLNFIELSSKRKIDENSLVINIPLKDKDSSKDSLTLLSITQRGFWVGLNRGENAALAAIKLLNYDNKHSGKLIRHRIEMKKKVFDADRAIMRLK